MEYSAHDDDIQRVDEQYIETCIGKKVLLPGATCQKDIVMYCRIMVKGSILKKQ